eukprot:12894013-Prorocentrum_lima.AAC.1
MSNDAHGEAAVSFKGAWHGEIGAQPCRGRTTVNKAHNIEKGMHTMVKRAHRLLRSPVTTVEQGHETCKG